MSKSFNSFPKKDPPPAKVIKQLVDSFCDTYKPVSTEDIAEEIFTMRKLREYFQAWPMPKMPDPLPPYLDELEQRGYAMQTGYDGSPSIFCLRWKSRGEICSAQEVENDCIRSGAESVGDILSRRIAERPASETRHPENQEPEEEDEDTDGDDEEKEDW